MEVIKTPLNLNVGRIIFHQDDSIVTNVIFQCNKTGILDTGFIPKT
ncbi:hypothetical protein PLIP_a3103 [Pseudoalteromonas lipolytica LMEB 39]|nr:hypothetical protein [Pseudoalteromonas lipolytica LMEB 39]